MGKPTLSVRRRLPQVARDRASNGWKKSLSRDSLSLAFSASSIADDASGESQSGSSDSIFSTHKDYDAFKYGIYSRPNRVSNSVGPFSSEELERQDQLELEVEHEVDIERSIEIAQESQSKKSSVKLAAAPLLALPALEAVAEPNISRQKNMPLQLPSTLAATIGDADAQRRVVPFLDLSSKRSVSLGCLSEHAGNSNPCINRICHDEDAKSMLIESSNCSRFDPFRVNLLPQLPRRRALSPRKRRLPEELNSDRRAHTCLGRVTIARQLFVDCSERNAERDENKMEISKDRNFQQQEYACFPMARSKSYSPLQSDSQLFPVPRLPTSFREPCKSRSGSQIEHAAF